MEDLASYFSNMGDSGKQELLAEQLRARQNNEYNQRLSQAFQGNPKLRMLAMAAMLSGNRGAEAAARFAHDQEAAGRAPRQLGNTGFFNAASGEFVENPAYVDEKRERIQQRRDADELRRTSLLDTLRSREDVAEENRRASAERAAADRALRAELAREGYALRASIAAMSQGSRADRDADRREDADWRTLGNAQSRADDLNKAADAARGNKPLNASDLKEIEILTNRAKGLGQLGSRTGDVRVGSTGMESSAYHEVGALARRWTPAFADAASQGTRDADKWWSDYRATFENKERNELFGSALTESEKVLWEKSNIQRGMTQEAIQQNLALRIGLANQALARRTGAMAKSGRSPEAISAATEDFYTPPPKPRAVTPRELLPPDVAGRLERRGVYIPPPSPTGSIAPNRSAPPKPSVRTPDGWTIEEE